MMKRISVIKSLQMRLVMVILTLMFIPMLLLFRYSFSKAETFIEQKVSLLLSDNFHQIGNQIENVCLDMTKLSNIISNDAVIISNLKPKDEFSADRAPSRMKDLYSLTGDEILIGQEIEDQLTYHKANMFFNYDLQSIILGADGSIFTAMDSKSEDFKFKNAYIKNYQPKMYKRLKPDKAGVQWTAPFMFDIPSFGPERRFISAAIPLKSLDKRTELGFALINIGEDSFKQILGNSVSGVVLLLNERKEVIFRTDYTEAEQQILINDISSIIPASGKGYVFTNVGKEKLVVDYYTLDRFGWVLVSVTSYKDMMKEIVDLKMSIYLVTFIGIAFFLMAGLLFILHITNPLKKLVRTIRDMRIGGHIVGTDLGEYSDDVGGIVRSFNFMVKRIDELVKTVIEEQQLEYELRYEALRAQITPHFLFNTLNTIKWSAMMSGSNNVAKMISTLGRLLEVSMSKGEEEITLREELELVRDYVFIQNARYNDKFVLELNVVDEVIKSLKVIRLVLQPIVENAIMHGLKNKTDNAVIQINAKKEENSLKIDVIDNGEGISEEKRIQLLSGNKDKKAKLKFNGIGLKNVHQRIRIKYGKEFGLQIASELSQGTTVSLVLPIIEQKEKNDEGGCLD